MRKCLLPLNALEVHAKGAVGGTADVDASGWVDFLANGALRRVVLQDIRNEGLLSTGPNGTGKQTDPRLAQTKPNTVSFTTLTTDAKGPEARRDTNIIVMLPFCRPFTK